MRRIKYFTSRNLKEILRDPLCFIFGLGLPLLMLIIMTVVNSAIPAQGAVDIFMPKNLAVGISVFSFSFVMLFTCLQVSKDRCSSFLIRLYTSPMKAFDYLLGYSVPFFFIGVIQSVITFAASIIIGFINHNYFDYSDMALSVLTMLPSVVMFVAFGLIFGSLLNDKSGPPMTSIIITLSGLVGGIWMPMDSFGDGAFVKVCKYLPFYPSTACARAAINGNYDNIAKWLLITCAYAVVLFVVAVFIFKAKMKSDKK